MDKIDIDVSKLKELREILSNEVVQVAENLKVLRLGEDKWLFYYQDKPYLVEYWQKDYYWKPFTLKD